MLFSSLTFLFLFLPTIILLYFICKKNNIKNIILLIFSLIFYSWGEPVYIFLMLFTIFISYFFGLLINKYIKNKKKQRIFLILSLITILCILGFYKYGNFIIENINLLFNLDINKMKLLLPIGISFYSIDLYRNKINVQKNILNLALYVSFFPQLIAGPIVRYETIEKELSDRHVTIKDIIYGSKRFIIGLSKKIIIANQMAIIADAIFNYSSPSELGTLAIWIGALAYTFQIYFDFSGYSDMAIGLGRIFGFHFPENFNYPYISKSITEFWHRWHISLSTWFRDYVYIPLGGNRVKKIFFLRNIIIVWTLTGLWHGAAWSFIIWGLYFAIILLLEKLFICHFLNKVPKLFGLLYAIILIIIGWVIFRSNSLNDLIIYLKTMFVYSPTNIQDLIKLLPQIIPATIYFIPAFIFSFPIINKKYHLEKSYQNIIFNIILLILFLICIMFLISSSYNPFIYFRF
ncbi:MAG: MBOAT family O-acyltransferase [Bacilli bacterium]